MVMTRSRSGTLPERTYAAVLHGTRPSGVMKPPRNRSRSQRPEDSDDAPDRIRVMSRMRTPHFVDELASIVEDPVEPYFGLFASEPKKASTHATQPTAEDRALFHQWSRPSQPIAANETESGLAANFNERLSIHYGQRVAMDAWYRSAYPAEYLQRNYLSICRFCLDFSMSDVSAERHALKCPSICPPGREIYRDGKLSMWEVDGGPAIPYCQNLCLLAKAFLSSKSLYRDVQPFLFYVLTETDESGPQFVGYFSKQKIYSADRPTNPIQCVSCIMALPFTQKQGYGQFLIDFSYMLTRRQGATGSPETPLSTLGERAFRSYWRRTMCYAVRDVMAAKQPVTISDLSRRTGIHVDHVVLGLEDLGWLRAKTQPRPALRVNEAQMHEIIEKWEARNPLKLKPDLLQWLPLSE